jgi:hypothetical protein
MKMKTFNKIKFAKNNTRPCSWFRIGHQAAGCEGTEHLQHEHRSTMGHNGNQG